MQTSVSTEWKLGELAGFQKLAEKKLSIADIQTLIRHPHFFRSPRFTDQINRQHSCLIDKILGFEVKTIETDLIVQARKVIYEGSFECWGPAIHDGAQTWVGLDPQTLNTPYAVLQHLCSILALKPGELVVDLGAAIGRLGIVMNQCAPNSRFLGLECVKERVNEANRVYQNLGIENSTCIKQDLFARDFELPEAEVYFIYDYGRHDQINTTLVQIERMSCKRPIKLVARGQATNRLISLNHPWLELVYEGESVENYKIYQA